ncbi:ABC transporter permease [Porphyromonas circumdentaria]|uniref:Putative ABC transport system permease protein n=1 Tax=Porphyromonas circumdentaria TaxID=29524 RepID=A0A1T4PCH5_9PORP|nr:ABC transporter permease [Porphyromonas circumdentaria]MBB6276375.1 putative ABC transport system permease protein [Porphyromonas circumdentaria]SJZ89037.1 putative ABC transport system permease protein [Porphyromonas circumdentaria]
MKKLFDSDTWREVFTTLKSNRRRTVVTAMGLFWGIFLLVILLSVGYGFNNSMQRELRGIAHNTLTTIPTTTTQAYKGFAKGRVWSFTKADIETLRQRHSEITCITPVNFNSGREETLIHADRRVPVHNVLGVHTDYFKILSLRVLEGRLLNEIDEREERNHCLIGQEIREQLFGSEPAIGQQVEYKGSSYTVVGVVKQASENINMFGSTNRMMLLTNEAIRHKNGDGELIDALVFSVSPHIQDTQRVLDRVNHTLRMLHDVAPDDTGAMMSFDLSQFFQMMDMLLISIYFLVWFVGIGTIISGIVGVSNIMLVTIRERTREIGVRRALGARPRDIIWQILLESVTLSTLAGMAGFIPSILLMIGVNSLLESSPSSFIYHPIIPFEVALLAVFIVVVSGILGGLLPVTRAIKIKAIEALRDE